MKFQGHYNENTLSVFVPTKLLVEEGQIRINIQCNPHACSDDGKKTTFGYWDLARAYLLGKDGKPQDEVDAVELKFEQGPLKPTKDSLKISKAATGNLGTATPE